MTGGSPGESSSANAVTARAGASLSDELRLLVQLAWPIATAQLGLVAMSLVDTAVLGQVSVQDLAGAAMGNSITFSVATLGMGLAVSLEPLAAQALGANRPRRAWNALLATVRSCLMLGVPAVLVGLAATRALPAMGVGSVIVARVWDNLLGRCVASVLFPVFLAGKTYLQAHGRTRPALVGAVLANVVNLVVCNLLVRGDDALRAVGLGPMGLPRLGAFGAGVANSVGSLVLTATVLGAAWAGRDRAAGSMRTADDPEDVVPARKVFALGLPMGLQLLAEVGVFGVVAMMAGRLGARVVSAHQIALGLASFTFMGALGVSGATAVRVGHAVGAGESPRRVGLLGIGLGAAVMCVGAVCFAAVPRALVRVFTPEADVIEVGAGLLRIAALFQLFDGVQAVASGALRGAGDVRFPFLANVGAHWLIGFPVALALGFGLGMGAQGLWWGLTAGLVAVSLALAARFVAISRGRIERV